jgi:hypothetical protein
MQFSTVLFLLVMFCVPLPASGDTLREVELTDGSILRAEVVSMSNGVYRLRSDTLGEIEIPELRIKAIRSPRVEATPPQMGPEPETASNPAVRVPPTPALAPSTEGLQQAFQQDPAAMEKILSLQDDPLVKSILDDADTMRAIQAGDLGTLMNDPKIRALMSHPTVQDLGGKLGQ